MMDIRLLWTGFVIQEDSMVKIRDADQGEYQQLCTHLLHLQKVKVKDTVPKDKMEQWLKLRELPERKKGKDTPPPKEAEEGPKA